MHLPLEKFQTTRKFSRCVKYFVIIIECRWCWCLERCGGVGIPNGQNAKNFGCWRSLELEGMTPYSIATLSVWLSLHFFYSTRLFSFCFLFFLHTHIYIFTHNPTLQKCRYVLFLFLKIILFFARAKFSNIFVQTQWKQNHFSLRVLWMNCVQCLCLHLGYIDFF